jgi:hypothetical protein
MLDLTEEKLLFLKILKVIEVKGLLISSSMAVCRPSSIRTLCEVLECMRKPQMCLVLIFRENEAPTLSFGFWSLLTRENRIDMREIRQQSN